MMLNIRIPDADWALLADHADRNSTKVQALVAGAIKDMIAEVPPRPPKRERAEPKPYAAIDAERVAPMMRDGLSDHQIAETVGASREGIRAVRGQLGIPGAREIRKAARS